MRASTALGLLGFSALFSAAVGCGDEFTSQPPAGGSAPTAGAGGTDTGGTGAGGGGLTGTGGAEEGGGGSAGADPGLPLGEPCAEGNECESGFCADEICCAEACADECYACSGEVESPGTCQPVDPATDPDEECADRGVCDGSGACADGHGLANVRFGSGANEQGYAIAAMSDGGVVVVGGFESAFTGCVPSLEPQGSEDVFVVRLASNGNVIWCRRYGDTSPQRATAVAVDAGADALDQITIAGWYQGEIDFDPNSDDYTMPAVGAITNAFIARLTGDGDLIWAYGPNPNGAAVEATGVAVDAAHDAFMVGRYAGAPEFNGTVLPDTDSTAFNPFVVKFESTGGATWAHGYDSQGDDAAWAVAIDTGGHIVIAGDFTTNIVLDEPIAGDLPGDGLVAWLAPSDGSPLDAMAIGGAGRQSVTGVAALTEGAIAVIGDFGTALAIGNQTIDAEGLSDTFVARLEPDGELSWVEVVGGSGTQTAGGIAFDGDNVIVTGSYHGESDLGTIELPEAFTSDVFVAKLADNGTPLWARGYNHAQIQSGHAITAGEARSIWVTGGFAGQISFGPSTLTSAGVQDVFVAHLAP